MSPAQLSSVTPSEVRHRTKVASDPRPALDRPDYHPMRNVNARLLIINDNGDLRRIVTNYLENQHMHVCSLKEQTAVFPRLEELSPDLVLLCHGALRDDGLNLLREIRVRSDVPVIMVSKNNSDEVDRVIGLELGADDYLTVPFGLRELYARVRAILRRNLRRDDLKSIIYTFAGWQLRPRTRKLLNPQGVELPLTKLEYALLTAFVAAPGRVLNREHLISATRLRDDVFDRAVDVQVCRLRRKLEFDPNTPSIIKTERGGGYRFDSAVQQVAFR